MKPAPSQIELRRGLTLVREAKSHASALLHLVERDREYLERFMTWPHAIDGLDAVYQHLEQSQQRASRGESLPFHILEHGQLVGGMGIYLQPQYTRGELGYWLSREAQGRGIVSRGLRALIRLGFEDLGLHRLELRISPENTRSLRLAEKFHFQREGHLRDAVLVGDSYQDMLVFGLLRREWSPDEVSLPD